MGTNRVVVIGAAALAALLVVVVTAVVTTVLVVGGGSGGGPSSEGGGEVAGQNPEPEEPQDVVGEWLLAVPVDTEDDEYDEGDPEVFQVLVTLERDNEGTLVGEGYSEYAGEVYDDIEVIQPEEIGGKTSFGVFDGSEGMRVTFEDETEDVATLNGYAEGYLGTLAPDVEGEFTARRRR